MDVVRLYQDRIIRNTPYSVAGDFSQSEVECEEEEFPGIIVFCHIYISSQIQPLQTSTTKKITSPAQGQCSGMLKRTMTLMRKTNQTKKLNNPRKRQKVPLILIPSNSPSFSPMLCDLNTSIFLHPPKLNQSQIRAGAYEWPSKQAKQEHAQALRPQLLKLQVLQRDGSLPDGIQGTIPIRALKYTSIYDPKKAYSQNPPAYKHCLLANIPSLLSST
eukprot:168917-Amorphochlora_amoeboformis.AAC.3